MGLRKGVRQPDESTDMSPARKTLALIADDHGLYRMGLKLLLEDRLGFAQVIEAGGFDEALDRLADTASIKLALFDLSMPGMGGPSSLAVVRASYPDLKVAVISGQDDRANVDATLAGLAACHGKKEGDAGGANGRLRGALVQRELHGCLRARLQSPRSAASDLDAQFC